MADRLASAPAVALAFAAYALAHSLLAALAGPTLALDDAKLNVVVQSFQRGYLPANPPLFEWTLIVAQAVFGPGAASFAVVKALFFAAAGGFSYAAARAMLADARRALLAPAALLLLFQFAWNYHQAFTHTTALIAATAFFWSALAHLFRERTMPHYLVLGLALGLGAIAKYSFLPVAAAAFAAMLLRSEGRSALADRRMAFAVLAAILVAAPHYHWLATQNAGAVDHMAARLSGGEAAHWRRALSGLGSAAGVMISFFLPMALAAFALAPRALARSFAGPESAGLRAARDAALIGAGLLFAAVIAIGMKRMEDRYVIPFLYPALFIFAAGLARAPGRRARAAFCLAAAGFALVGIGFKALVNIRPGPPFCDECRQYAPFEALENGLRARGFAGEGVLVGLEETTAGNLRRLFPDARVLYANLPDYAPPLRQTDGPCLFVWSPDLAPEPSLASAFASGRVSIIAGRTRPLAGEARRIRWFVAEALPGEPAYREWCERPASRR